MTMARNCPNCQIPSGMMRFEGEALAIEHAGMSAMLEGLSGWRCEVCDEVVFDVDSAERYAAAGDQLVLRSRAAEQGNKGRP
jgi:HTH-type transcriptional regulator / antitoxin MqsA